MPKYNKHGELLIEARFDTPKHFIDVLHAVANAEARLTGKDVSLTDIHNRILSSYVKAKVDESTLIQRAVGSNPIVSDKG